MKARFSDFEIDTGTREVTRAGQRLALEPRSFDLLSYLLQHRDRAVSKDELQQQVWGTIVTDSALTRCAMKTRKALEDDSESIIRTVPRFGYQFVAEVDHAGEQAEAAPHVPAAKRRAMLAAGFVALAVLAFGAAFFGLRSDAVDTSIAVLPFVNISDDPNNDYFSDGISQEILNMLAGIPELRVTSRSSAFSFKGQNLDVPTMAARLNVDHVLEGSVRKEGNQLRVTAQLIDVASDTNLWSETYDRQFDSVFAIQEEIAAAVADALHLTLLGEHPAASETDPATYSLYLQGRHLGIRGNSTAASIRQAEALLKQALQSDPEFAPAWVELTNVYLLQSMVFGIRPYDESAVLAHEAIERALSLDPRNGRAYAMLGRVEMNLDWDFDTAYGHLQQALELDDGSAEILQIAGRLEITLGRTDAAIELYRRALALDPLAGYLGLGICLQGARRLDEAIDAFRTGISFSPGAAVLHYRLGLALLDSGDAQAALAAAELEPDEGWRLAGLSVIQYALGDIAAADAALAELIDKFASDSAFQIAEAYAFRGEVDLAFEWLDRAYDNRDSGMTNLLLAPLIANLRDDSRWPELLERMGLGRR